MPSNQAIPVPSAGVVGASGELWFHSQITLGTSGAVTAASTTMAPGVTITKTGSETGRYTITMAQNYSKLLNVIVALVGADDAAWGAVSVGLHHFLRDIDVGSGANDGTFELQFVDASTNFADTELPNGTLIRLSICVDRGL
jgi:hypothetical protein